MRHYGLRLGSAMEWKKVIDTILTKTHRFAKKSVENQRLCALERSVKMSHFP